MFYKYHSHNSLNKHYYSAHTDVAELKGISDILLREIEYSSSLLVRLLQVKDKRTLKASRQEDRLSAILRDYACKNG